MTGREIAGLDWRPPTSMSSPRQVGGKLAKLDWLSPRVEAIRRLRETRSKYNSAFPAFWEKVASQIDVWIGRYNEVALGVLPRVRVDRDGDSLVLNAVDGLVGRVSPDIGNARIVWQCARGQQRFGYVPIRVDQQSGDLVGRFYPSERFSPGVVARELLSPVLFHEEIEDPLAGKPEQVSS
jgi:hypothetical protein